jgi:hypothetical protein
MVLRLVLVICPLTGHSFFAEPFFFISALFILSIFFFLISSLVASAHSPLHISFTDNDCFLLYRADRKKLKERPLNYFNIKAPHK